MRSNEKGSIRHQLNRIINAQSQLLQCYNSHQIPQFYQNIVMRYLNRFSDPQVDSLIKAQIISINSRSSLVQLYMTSISQKQRLQNKIRNLCEEDYETDIFPFLLAERIKQLRTVNYQTADYLSQIKVLYQADVCLQKSCEKAFFSQFARFLDNFRGEYLINRTEMPFEWGQQYDPFYLRMITKEEVRESSACDQLLQLEPGDSLMMLKLQKTLEGWIRSCPFRIVKKNRSVTTESRVRRQVQEQKARFSTIDRNSRARMRQNSISEKKYRIETEIKRIDYYKVQQVRTVRYNYSNLSRNKISNKQQNQKQQYKYHTIEKPRQSYHQSFETPSPYHRNREDRKNNHSGSIVSQRDKIKKYSQSIKQRVQNKGKTEVYKITYQRHNTIPNIPSYGHTDSDSKLQGKSYAEKQRFPSSEADSEVTLDNHHQSSKQTVISVKKESRQSQKLQLCSSKGQKASCVQTPDVKLLKQSEIKDQSPGNSNVGKQGDRKSKLAQSRINIEVSMDEDYTYEWSKNIQMMHQEKSISNYRDSKANQKQEQSLKLKGSELRRQEPPRDSKGVKKLDDLTVYQIEIPQKQQEPKGQFEGLHYPASEQPTQSKQTISLKKSEMSSRIHVKARAGSYSFQSFKAYIRTYPIHQLYADKYNIEQIISLVSLTQSYVTQFFINQAPSALGLSTVASNNAVIVVMWIIAEKCPLKHANILFSQYVLRVQKKITNQTVYFKGKELPQVTKNGFTLKKQGLYERKRKNKVNSQIRSTDRCLSIKCHHTSVPHQQNNKIFLNSSEYGQFDHQGSHCADFLHSFSDLKIPKNIKPYFKIQKGLPMYKIRNYQIHNIDISAFEILTAFKSVFVAHQNKLKFYGNLLMAEEYKTLCSVQLSKNDGLMFFGKGFDSLEKFQSKLKAYSELKCSQRMQFVVPMFYKRLIGKYLRDKEKEINLYGSWEISLSWEDDIQGCISHQMNSVFSLGNSFCVGVELSHELVLSFRVSETDILE